LRLLHPDKLDKINAVALNVGCFSGVAGCEYFSGENTLAAKLVRENIIRIYHTRGAAADARAQLMHVPESCVL
jgi:hypothetical protein